MSINSTVKGPYPTPPSANDDRIRAAMETFRPENIHGLAWGPPDLRSNEHRIVLSFDIDRKKRLNSEYIPCAMCSGIHPKFLSGSVLWSSDGWLRVIGHVCARKPENFGEAGYRRLQVELKQADLDNTALDWLTSNIGAIRPLASDVRILRVAMEHLERQQSILFKGVPTLARRLSEAALRRGGRLTVSRELSSVRVAAAGSQEFGFSVTSPMSRYEEVDVALLKGATFLQRPRIPRSRQLASILEAFEMLPAGEGDEPIMELIDRGGEHHVTLVARALLRAIQRAITLADDYAGAAEFMSKDNLDGIERWGGHIDNEAPFSIQRSDGEVIFKLADLSRARLSRAWPQTVDLSAWRAVAGAGGLLARKAQR